MSGTVYKVTALEVLRLPANTPLEKRAKFFVGKAEHLHKTSFIKIARDDQDPNSSQDLGNEIVWNLHARKQLDKSGFKVPEVKCFNPKNHWALFEFLDGKTITQDQLPDLLPEIARLCARISDIEYLKQNNGVGPWMASRIARLKPEVGTPHMTPELLDEIEYMTSQIEGNADLQSGFVHGDFKPDNILYLPNNRGQLAIVDSEFGTNPLRPERELPKYHDAAYFYHLLHTQYHDIDLAKRFKELFKQELVANRDFDPDTFEVQFNSSVLERTVSMGSHFVWRRDPNRPVADPRRIQPEPYIELIESTLDAITL